MTQECRKDQSATKALISGLIGIILFLIVLIIFSSIADYLSSPLFSGFVDLLYANAALVIIFSVLFMFGDIFAAFVFPFNLPFPLFNAAASVLLVSFILSIMEFIDSFYALGIGSSLQIVSLILYPLTFVIVLVAGYISIFYRNPGTCPPLSGQTDNNTPAEKPSWEEVGGEFRQMVFDFFRRIRNELNRK